MVKSIKKFLVFLVLIFNTVSYSQFNYQSILKDSNGDVITNTPVKFKFSIYYDSTSSEPVFSETHSLTTPSDGVINLLVGSGAVLSGSVSFTAIDWSVDQIYFKKEVDINNSGTYTDYGSDLFKNVPKAEYARKLNNVLIDSINISVGIKAQPKVKTSINVPSSSDADDFGIGNIAIGIASLESNLRGKSNTAIGTGSLNRIENGWSNTAVGESTLLYLTEGEHNTSIGGMSGSVNTITNGSYLTFIGAYSSALESNLTNSTAIGANAIVTASNTIQLGDPNVTLVQTSGTVSATDFVLNGFSIDSRIQVVEDAVAYVASSNEVAALSDALAAALSDINSLLTTVASLQEQIEALQSSNSNFVEISYYEYIDFETGNTDTSSFGPSSSEYDLVFANNSNTTISARMWWNESSANMALVYDISYDNLKITDVDNYYFCQHINDTNISCANTDTPPTDFVGIVETYEGNYYAVKYISETTSDVIFKYRKL